VDEAGFEGDTALTRLLPALDTWPKLARCDTFAVAHGKQYMRRLRERSAKGEDGREGGTTGTKER